MLLLAASTHSFLQRLCASWWADSLGWGRRVRGSGRDSSWSAVKVAERVPADRASSEVSLRT